MTNYRLYRLDGAGNITSAEWIEAADDEAAAMLIREQMPQGTAEIWEGSRLVGRIGPGEPTEA